MASGGALLPHEHERHHEGAPARDEQQRRDPERPCAPVLWNEAQPRIARIDETSDQRVDRQHEADRDERQREDARPHVAPDQREDGAERPGEQESRRAEKLQRPIPPQDNRNPERRSEDEGFRCESALRRVRPVHRQLSPR